jgi:hypothetical protein
MYPKAVTFSDRSENCHHNHSNLHKSHIVTGQSFPTAIRLIFSASADTFSPFRADFGFFRCLERQDVLDSDRFLRLDEFPRIFVLAVPFAPALRRIWRARSVLRRAGLPHAEFSRWGHRQSTDNAARCLRYLLAVWPRTLSALRPSRRQMHSVPRVSVEV